MSTVHRQFFDLRKETLGKVSKFWKLLVKCRNFCCWRWWLLFNHVHIFYLYAIKIGELWIKYFIQHSISACLLYTYTCCSELGTPLNTWRNNNVVIQSQRPHSNVITSKLRRFGVITTSLLRNVSDGMVPNDGSYGALNIAYPCLNRNYHQTSNIRDTLRCNKIVDHTDVFGASPVGAAPTTSSF